MSKFDISTDLEVLQINAAELTALIEVQDYFLLNGSPIIRGINTPSEINVALNQAILDKSVLVKKSIEEILEKDIKEGNHKWNQ